MRDCSAQLADAELLTAHRENRREDVHRMRVRWRWRAYLGLDGVPEPKALLLSVVQGHVPVPAQKAFRLPDSLVGEPRRPPPGPRRAGTAALPREQAGPSAPRQGSAALTAATSACALLTSAGRYRSCSPGPGTRQELRHQARLHGIADRSPNPHGWAQSPNQDRTIGPTQAMVRSGAQENKGIRASAGGPLPALNPVRSKPLSRNRQEQRPIRGAARTRR